MASSSLSPPTPFLQNNPSAPTPPSSSPSAPNNFHPASSTSPSPSHPAAPPDFDFLHNHPRAALNYIVRLTFPQLLSIMRQLEQTIHNRSTSPSDPSPHPFDAPFHIQRTICKIFWSFTQYDLPTFLLQDLSGVFSDWMHIFLRALNRPVDTPPPTSNSPPPPSHLADTLSADMLPTLPQWKVKQWIAHIVYRLFQRYSNPSRLNPYLLRNFDTHTLEAFADYFRRNFAPSFTQAMLHLLSQNQTQVSPRVANLALLYLESAVSPGLTYKVIKPTLDHLITNIIFPYLCIGDADLQLWEDDPVEYVRKTYDVLEDFNTPRAAACSLLLMMSKLRRSAVVSPLMGFLVQILDAYAACRIANDHQRLPMLARQKDGALLAIGTIRETLMSTPQSARELERLLNAHVIAEFHSDVPFLRARACWIYGQLTAAENVSLDVVLPGLEGVQKCLLDKEFPVRVRAAVNIRHFLQNKVAAERISPSLADLLQLLFSLLDDIDNTDIVATIDQVVVGFSDDIAPYAGTLCGRLVDTFSRAAAVGQADDEAGYAAAQCIQALESIVTSVAFSNVPDKIRLLAEIETTIGKVFDHMFEVDRIEYFEEALELLATFVYHSSEERGVHLRAARASGVEPDEYFLGHEKNGSDLKRKLYENGKLLEGMENDVAQGGGVISPYLWSLFPSAMYAFHNWASDYSFHYIHLVDSYLSKCPRVFMESTDGETSYMKLLLGMISRLWDESSSEEDDFATQGSRVCGLLLQHCRRVDERCIDSEVGILTQLVVKRLWANSESIRAVGSLFRSLAHLLYVAPLTALTVMDEDSTVGCTSEVFKLWMSLVQQGLLDGRYDRKASAIALSAILGLDWSCLPTQLRNSIPQLVLTIVSLLESLAGPEKRKEERCRGDFVKDEQVGGGRDMEDDGGDVDCMDGEGGVVIQSNDDGENPMFCLLHSIDELLYFESVIRNLGDDLTEQLVRALAKEDGLRVESTLMRAAVLRQIPVVPVDGGVGAGGGGGWR